MADRTARDHLRCAHRNLFLHYDGKAVYGFFKNYCEPERESKLNLTERQAGYRNDQFGYSINKDIQRNHYDTPHYECCCRTISPAPVNRE
ncbi:hypothetical protein D3C73_1323600 [compost metagenome]